MRRLLLIGIWIVLITSILFLHAQTVTRPLIGHHDLIDGIILTVTSVWDRDGVFTHFFAPVYSYSADINLEHGFGVPGRTGRMYYVSYPPGTYILFYLFSKIFFLGITVFSVRILGLLSFIVTSILLFWHLYRRYGSLEAFVGIGVFSLFPISSYFLGGHFFYDTIIFPFWILLFLLFRKLVLRPWNLTLYFLFFGLLFFLSFTEWIGYFLTASLILFVFLFGKKFDWGLRYRLIFLSNLMLSSLLSLGLTYLVFVRQIESVILNNQLVFRFFYRTNLGLSGEGVPTFEYFKNFLERYLFHTSLGFGTYFYLLFGFVLSTLGIGLIFKIHILKKNEFWYYFFFFLSPGLLHFVVLNNHLYEHDFANLYILIFIVMMFIWSFGTVKALIEKRVRNKSLLDYILIVTAVLYVILIPITSQNGYKTYFSEWISYEEETVAFIEGMNRITREHDLIITNHDSSPMMWYYLQRNVIGMTIGEDVERHIGIYPRITDTYYMSDKDYNTRISCGIRPVLYKDLVYYCKLD